MEDFAKLDCGCYVGFDVHHKPMWGKKCPKHEATDDLYEALKEAVKWIVYDRKEFGIKGTNDYLLTQSNKALAKAEGK